jgi:hypothetical protein
VLWRTHWELGEHIGNLMGTWREHVGNQGKKLLSYCHLFQFNIHESWTLSKPYGIKLRCYWEQIGNPMGTTRKQQQTLSPPISFLLCSLPSLEVPDLERAWVA